MVREWDPTQRPGPWDYLLFSELINLCRYFTKLRVNKYIPLDEPIPESPDRFLFHDKQDVALKEKSDKWFKAVGLWISPQTSMSQVTTADDCSQVSDTGEVDHEDEGSQVGSAVDAGYTGEGSQAGSAGQLDDHADECSQPDSEWITASTISSPESSTFNFPTTTTTRAPSTPTPPDLTITAEHWRAIAVHAARLRAVYARNLPTGLSALPLPVWTAADMLRAALVGVFRTFTRIARYLHAVFDAADWSGAVFAVLVRRACAEVHNTSRPIDRARVLAQSTLGRVLVLCCPWRKEEAKRGWVAVVVGWIAALGEHQERFERDDVDGETAVEDKAEDDDDGLEREVAVDDSDYFSCQGDL
ncbi:hypothetical protein IWX49DRAFT_638026 [Phyllosticta citricarpa]|uniref:Uncharacterized protein n=2 Tax=Phyllosticta TaxID=121621 RepID=A0ABR1MN14_9PEZI